MFEGRRLKLNLQRLIADVSGFIPGKDVSEADLLTEHGEYGPAFELICEQLYEYLAGEQISEGLYSQIEELGRSMGVDESSWSFLDPRMFIVAPFPHIHAVVPSVDDVVSMRSAGRSAEQACKVLFEAGIRGVGLVRLLRRGYGLSLDEAVKIARSVEE